MKKSLAAISVVLLSAVPMIALGAGKAPPRDQQHISGSDIAQAILFTEMERQIFGEHLSQQGYGKPAKMKELPPGLKKKVARGGELPPGWQDKVRRGEVLDADLYRHSQNLPDDILRRLPRRAQDTAIRQIDDRIILVDTVTRAVLDVYFPGY